MTWRRWANVMLGVLVAAALALSGCGSGGGGGDGDGGGLPSTPPEDPGDGEVPAIEVFSLLVESPTTLTFDVTKLTIASPPVVDFTVTDPAGRGAVDLALGVTSGNLGRVRFSIAKLVPGTLGDPDSWFDYVTGERLAANLVDHRDGSYTYTFLKDLGAYNAAIPYEASRTHRLAMQSSGGSWAPVNLVEDFVPDQLPGPFTLPLTRDIVTTAACNECHGELTLHGSRYDTRYCVVCHNPTLGEGDFAVMVHSIHAAHMRTTEYELGGHAYGEVTYPQDLRHCLKCHDGTDGASYKTRPSAEACTGCHDGLDLEAGTIDGVPGAHLALVDSQACHLCHTEDNIVLKHTTDNATPNNPTVPAGAANFTYEISDVVVNGSNQPVVTFRINRDGVPVTFNTFVTGGKVLLEGFTGSPSFLVAYAMQEDGFDAPADYNNLGKAAGQPVSVSIANAWNGTEGGLSGPDANGWYVATLNGKSGAGRFPEGATMRAVALQGYFTQVSPALARHTISVVRGVTGDAVRRQVVDPANCAKCHEWFEGHGGNRVYETQVCVTCHLPNLSSSGRGADLSAYVPGSNASTDATIAEVGGDPLLWPEDTNNFKDLIHGIHGAGKRTTPYEFVRDRGSSGIYFYDWSEVTFPGVLNDCTTCHLPGTYEMDALVGGLLPTNRRTTTGNPAETGTDVANARKSVPNATDLVNSPIASACYYCHDSDPAIDHMEQNGGAIAWPRSQFLLQQPTESCIVCHGEGRMADLNVVHAK
jgi:OmcA/MtrC family decaheme c-type cytochrome